MIYCKCFDYKDYRAVVFMVKTFAVYTFCLKMIKWCVFHIHDLNAPPININWKLRCEKKIVFLHYKQMASSCAVLFLSVEFVSFALSIRSQNDTENKNILGDLVTKSLVCSLQYSWSIWHLNSGWRKKGQKVGNLPPQFWQISESYLHQRVKYVPPDCFR